jgi:hypothetical protein
VATKTSKYIPPQCEEQLVLAWLRRARESQLAHYKMADALTKKGRFLGAPSSSWPHLLVQVLLPLSPLK